MPGVPESWASRLLAPQLLTEELDQIMARIFDQLAQDKQAIVEAVVKIIRSVPNELDYQQDIRRIAEEISAIIWKKDRLLEMSIERALSTTEFKQRNERFNQQLQELERQKEVLNWKRIKSKISVDQLSKIKTALEEEITFQNGIPIPS